MDSSAREVIEFLGITNNAVITRYFFFWGGGGEIQWYWANQKLMYQLNNSNTIEKVSLSLGHNLQEALRRCLAGWFGFLLQRYLNPRVIWFV